MARKQRTCFSYTEELLKKSQEAALSAVCIFNNPNIEFKSESFIVLMNIAWTYLMHAYYRKNNIDYRYYTTKGQTKRKFYDKTKRGAYKYWELERCLNDKKSPIDKATKDNLIFLIGIRHEIEHQMTTQIDHLISAKFQACSMNYNQTIIKLFGKKYGLSDKLQIAIQFFGFSDEQTKQLVDFKDVPQNIIDFIADFENELSAEDLSNPKFSYKVIYVRENANRSGQADKAYRFIDEKSAVGKEIQNILVKPGKEAAKYKPKQIVELMRKKGYTDFTIRKHTEIWQKANAKNKKLNYGVELEDGQWYWYYSWFLRVEQEYKKMLDEKANEESTHE
ncbi:MAG: DUF3644 domain-containing protein [Candidatus Gastranaerophilales bacterium]|nr:DUF3644 domain-containing protein [Candidatus Gastranaerophilales bacterium]